MTLQSLNQGIPGNTPTDVIVLGTANAPIRVTRQDSLLILYHADTAFDTNHGVLRFQVFLRRLDSGTEINAAGPNNFHAQVHHSANGEHRRVAIAHVVQPVTSGGEQPTDILPHSVKIVATGPANTVGNVENQFLQVFVLKDIAPTEGFLTQATAAQQAAAQRKDSPKPAKDKDKKKKKKKK